MCVCVAVWHLVAQILYFVGALLVLLSLVFSQAQLCCRRERASTIRTLSGVLLFSCKTLFWSLLSLLSLTFQNMDPLRFQAGGCRRRPNLGLVCSVLMSAVFLVKDAYLFSSCRFSFSLVMSPLL